MSRPPSSDMPVVSAVRVLGADSSLGLAVRGGVQGYDHVGAGAGGDGDLPADVLARLQPAHIGHRSPGHGERMVPHRRVAEVRLGVLAKPHLEGEWRVLPVVGRRQVMDRGRQRRIDDCRRHLCRRHLTRCDAGQLLVVVGVVGEGDHHRVPRLHRR